MIITPSEDWIVAWFLMIHVPHCAPGPVLMIHCSCIQARVGWNCIKYFPRSMIMTNVMAKGRVAGLSLGLISIICSYSQLPCSRTNLTIDINGIFSYYLAFQWFIFDQFAILCASLFLNSAKILDFLNLLNLIYI